MDIKQQNYQLIDDLKAVCHSAGLGNDGNEYKVITQVFLYKFLNDKFGYEIKKANKTIREAKEWETAYAANGSGVRHVLKQLKRAAACPGVQRFGERAVLRGRAAARHAGDVRIRPRRRGQSHHQPQHQRQAEQDTEPPLHILFHKPFPPCACSSHCILTRKNRCGVFLHSECRSSKSMIIRCPSLFIFHLFPAFVKGGSRMSPPCLLAPYRCRCRPDRYTQKPPRIDPFGPGPGLTMAISLSANSSSLFSISSSGA